MCSHSEKRPGTAGAKCLSAQQIGKINPIGVVTTELWVIEEQIFPLFFFPSISPFFAPLQRAAERMGGRIAFILEADGRY